MTLQEDLKGKAVAIVSQQMANWVVEIQRQISEHQANLVRSLDELNESVARYDEKIDEAQIEMSMAEVAEAQPPAGPAGPAMAQVRASVGEIEKGANLSEVLTHLVNEVARYVDRAAMFIVKGPNAIGWYGKGFDNPESVKQVSIPLNADTVFRIVGNSRHALRGHVSHSPGTAQALARLGGAPQGVLAVPLILRDKLAAVLYCDTMQEEVPEAESAAVEMLVLFAAKSIDLLSLLPKAAPGAPAAARTTGAGAAPAGVAAMRAEAQAAAATAPAPRPAAPPPPPPPADEGSSTVMFNASQFAQMRQQIAGASTPPKAPAMTPAPPAAPAMSPEEQKAHDDAKRFARLVVSEIKLYNEAKVAEGRKNRDIYERLKEDIERGRAMYAERVPAPIRDNTNYFVDELVRILAGGDAGALGPM